MIKYLLLFIMVPLWNPVFAEGPRTVFCHPRGGANVSAMLKASLQDGGYQGWLEILEQKHKIKPDDIQSAYQDVQNKLVTDLKLVELKKWREKKQSDHRITIDKDIDDMYCPRFFRNTTERNKFINNIKISCDIYCGTEIPKIPNLNKHQESLNKLTRKCRTACRLSQKKATEAAYPIEPHGRPSRDLFSDTAPPKSPTRLVIRSQDYKWGESRMKVKNSKPKPRSKNGSR